MTTTDKVQTTALVVGGVAAAGILTWVVVKAGKGISDAFKGIGDGLGNLGGLVSGLTKDAGAVVKDAGSVARDITGTASSYVGAVTTTTKTAIGKAKNTALGVLDPRRVEDLVFVAPGLQPLTLIVLKAHNDNSFTKKGNTVDIEVRLPDGSPAVNAKVSGVLLPGYARLAAVSPGSAVVSKHTDVRGRCTLSWTAYNARGAGADGEDDRDLIANLEGYNSSNIVRVK